MYVYTYICVCMCVYVCLLQIKSAALICPMLPSLATLLFNRPTRGISPRFRGPPILSNKDESNLTALINRQTQLEKYKDAYRNITFIPTGPMVAMQREDSGTWMHGTIYWQRMKGHNGRSYKIRVMPQ